MSIAFAGDPAVKAALLARLEQHGAAGTLMFGPTRWNGVAGSPLGVSIAGEDSADYAVRFGYPLPLAALLDQMTAWSAPDRAIADMLQWVGCVEPGADLSDVPRRIVDDMLRRMGADRLAGSFHDALRELHRSDASGKVVPRRQWSTLRAAIEQAMAEAGEGSDRAVALDACAAACWPLGASRSVLGELFDRWRRDILRQPDPAFGPADKAESEAMLESIFAETQPQRDAGEAVDIPAIFRVRAPDLCARFEAHLTREHERFDARTQEIPGIVLKHLATAGAIAMSVQERTNPTKDHS